MGQDLAEAFPDARAAFEEADDVLGFGLSEVMWQGPEEHLRETQNAQPALFVHSLAAHRIVEKELGPVAFAAGHSLGELSAHGAAGTYTFSDGLLEAPCYTRPPEFQGFEVPEVLTSGNHAKIQEWKRARSLERTRENRPDLLD